MNIVITGASGFIGTNIYNDLINHYNVIGIDISPGMKKCYYYIDLVNSHQIENFFHSNKNIDVIIHSAALAHNKGSDLSFYKFKQVNYEATKNLVDLSNKYLNLKKFIFFSTISVYGEKLNKDIYFETDDTNPKTPYAVTKKMSENYIVTNAKFSYTILRFAPVYGEKFTLNIDRRTIIGNKIYKVGNGNNKISILNIKNILLVIKFLLENLKSCNNEIFNLADKRLYSFNDLILYQLKRLKSIRVLKIPKFIIYLTYLFGNIIKNNFLIENSIKLISNNIYDTSKISSRILLPYDLNDAL
jgi:nucleoside-diphosphate-sugar epimerase